MSTTPPSPTAQSAASSPNPSSQVPGGNGRRAPGVRGRPRQDHDRAHRRPSTSARWRACFVAWPTASTKTAAAPPALRPSPTRRASRPPAPRPRARSPGGCGTMTALRCWRRRTAFHARRSRQAALAAHVKAMEEPSTVPAGDQHQPPSEPVPPGGQGGRDPAARAPEPPAPASSRPPPVNPHGLPGPRLGELDAAAAAGLWGLLAELRRGEVTPPGQLLRLTRRLPAELAGQLLSVLDGGPALVRAEAVRVLEAADPQNPATPALAVVVLGWLEAAEQALAAGASAQELRVLLGVAGQEGNLG